MKTIRKDGEQVGALILETKGFDPKEDYKRAAAIRWVKAVNYDGQYGRWAYRVLHDPTGAQTALEDVVEELTQL